MSKLGTMSVNMIFQFLAEQLDIKSTCNSSVGMLENKLHFQLLFLNYLVKLSIFELHFHECVIAMVSNIYTALSCEIVNIFSPPQSD